jgi:N-methylhydantoinase A
MIRETRDPASNGDGAGSLRVGVDIGGTFTDLTVADEEGIIAVGKVLTTPDEPADAVETVLKDTLARCGIHPGDVRHIIHGTTLVTNAIIERKGALSALLATEGFRDVLEIGHERRVELYDLMVERPRPLVPRHLRFDVPERTLADGTIERAVDEDHVARLAKELIDRGIEAVAVGFLHSYANGANESAARDVIRRVAPSLRVAISSEIVPEMREYERTSTTVASVYVQDKVARYLHDLVERLRGLGANGPLYVMLSNGGIATVETASRWPIRLLESGPAAGALAAAAFGANSGRADVLSFDMGGTTAKLCMIADREPLVAHEFEVDRVYRLTRGSGLPVKTPVIDMIEIGVGGGSIARVDPLGLLGVGPDSAGSNPGPVSYGLGGTEPTVTDADLVLGYLDPDYFLGGRMRLNLDAAREVIRDRIAVPLGLSVQDAAWGIHRSVNEDMANAARVHAVERGKDPSRLPIFAFGGAGPVHGVGVGRALGASALIVPAAAGVMSSVGFLTAPLAFDFVRSARALLDEIAWDRAGAIFAEMEEEGRVLLKNSSVSDTEITHARSVDMRYVGQGFEIRVPAPLHPDGWPDTLLDSFDRRYRELYGRAGPDVPVEIIHWRVVSSGPRPSLRLRPHMETGKGLSRKGARRAYFGHFVDAAVYDRYALREGDVLDGPAIVEEAESTLVMPPNTRCVIAGDLSLEVELAATHESPGVTP